MQDLKSKFREYGENNYQKNSIIFDSYLDLKKYNLEKLKLEKDNKDYLIDILPYTIETDNHPNNKRKGDIFYCLDIYIHNYIGLNKGSYLCMKKTYNKECKICNYFEKLKNELENKDLDKEEVWSKTKDFYPQQRSIYHIKYKDKLYILDVSYKLFEKIWQEAIDKKKKRGIEIYPYYIDSTCQSLEFTIVPKGQFYNIINFDFPNIENYNEKWKQNLISLEKILVIPDQNKLEQILQGNEEIIEKEDNDFDKTKNSYFDTQIIKEHNENERKKKNKCPSDFNFGVEWDEYTNCDTCQEKTNDTYLECKRIYKENQK